MKQVVFGRGRAVRLAVAMAIVMLATMDVFLPAGSVAAQDTATIEIVNTDAGSGQPAPFTRFQVTSENGTVYGPMETDLNGVVTFSVTVDPWGTRFTIEEETPPACAPAPDPQTTDPLAPGDSATMHFTTQDEPDCGLGTIALYAMACPEGFSGPTDDYAPWRDGCTGVDDGTPFTITSVDTGQSWHPVAGAYGIPGRAPIVGLPAGDYTFQQDDGPPAAVFCLVYDTSNYATSPAPSSVLPVDLDDGVGSISLAGNRVSCDLFTVTGGTAAEPPIAPVEPATTASLDVHLATCPPGYSADTSIYDDCHGNGIAGQPVRVGSDIGYSGVIASVVPVTPGPGVASFSGLPAGFYTVSTDVPADTDSLIYCTDASDTQIPVAFDDAAGAFTLTISAGASVTCDWYELPAAVVPASGTSFIEVHSLLCPNGTAPESDLYGACHADGRTGVTISASGPNGFSDQQITITPAVPGPGIVTFADLPGGTYTLTQEQIDPGWVVVMYCSLADADDVVPFTETGSGTISLDVPNDTGVVCDFYSIPPADQDTTLQVTSYRCPANMVADDTWTRDDFLAICEPSGGTTQFTLTPEGLEGVTLTTGSAGVGTVLFEGLPTGIYALSSSIPGEFNTAYVFCGLEGGALDTRGIDGATIGIDASRGTYVCQWFNDGENLSGYSDTLTVTSFLCPPGTDGNYSDRCGGSPLTGGAFQLEAFNWSMLGTVSDDGATTVFENLTMGDYRLTSLPPSNANVAVYVVTCEGGGQDIAFDYDDSGGMSIALRMPGGVDVNCDWYNVPPGQPTVLPGAPSGSITVHKLLCQGKAVASYSWDADCVKQSAPAGFALKTADGRPIAVGSTDGDGLLMYTKLADGAYSLDETTGDWCHAEADRVDSAGNVLVKNGANTDVFIYNCSVRQVGRLPSTGTGTSPAAAAFDGDKLGQLALAAGAMLGIALIARYRLQQAAVEARRHEDAAIPGDRLDDVL